MIIVLYILAIVTLGVIMAIFIKSNIEDRKLEKWLNDESDQEDPFQPWKK